MWTVRAGGSSSSARDRGMTRTPSGERSLRCHVTRTPPMARKGLSAALYCARRARSEPVEDLLPPGVADRIAEGVEFSSKGLRRSAKRSLGCVRFPPHRR